MHKFLGTVCDIINIRPSVWFCTDRDIHICLDFVELMIELSPTYKMIKPYMKFLLDKFGFPTICLTPEDIDMFECNPHEFVHHQK